MVAAIWQRVRAGCPYLSGKFIRLSCVGKHWLRNFCFYHVNLAEKILILQLCYCATFRSLIRGS